MSANSLGLVSWIATLVSDVGSPTLTLVASILGFLLALIGRHLLGRAALRWCLALRDAPPDQRAEIIRALTRQSPTRPEAGADQRRQTRWPSPADEVGGRARLTCAPRVRTASAGSALSLTGSDGAARAGASWPGSVSELDAPRRVRLPRRTRRWEPRDRPSRDRPGHRDVPARRRELVGEFTTDLDQPAPAGSRWHVAGR